MRIGGQDGAEGDIAGFFAFALEQQVGLADGVGLRVQFLAVQVDFGLLPLLASKIAELGFADRQHASGAAGVVIEKIGAVSDAVLDRAKDQFGHHLHDVARRELFTGALVVVFVEAAKQLLEDRTHSVVIEAGQEYTPLLVSHGCWRQIDPLVAEFLDQRVKPVMLREPAQLVSELEARDDFLDVFGKSVKVGLEVGLLCLGIGSGEKLPESEGGTVMKGLTGRTVECGTLGGLRDAGCVQFRFPGKNCGAGGFKHRVQPPEDCHRQNDVTIFGAVVDIVDHVIGYAPDEAVDVHAGGRPAKGTALAGRISLRNSPARSTGRRSRGLTTVSSHKSAITPSSFWLRLF